MSEYFVYEQSERERLIVSLTNELPTLRAKAAITQDELARAIGISRQTYNAIETKGRPMSWNTYMSLILFFDRNPNTCYMLQNIVELPDEVVRSNHRNNKHKED